MVIARLILVFMKYIGDEVSIYVRYQEVILEGSSPFSDLPTVIVTLIKSPHCYLWIIRHGAGGGYIHKYISIFLRCDFCYVVR